MKRIINENVLLLLGGLAIIFGMLLLAMELVLLQFMHYYTWASNIAYKLPHEFFSEPFIMIAFILTLVIIVLGMILVGIDLLYRKSK